MIDDIYADRHVGYEIHAFGNAEAFLRYASENAPDILLLDIYMPGTDGFALAEECNKRFPDALLIFVSECESRVYQSFRFSPFRFVRKSELAGDLGEALNSAAERYFLKYTTVPLPGTNINNQPPVAGIIYCTKEKEGNYMQIVSTDGTARVRITMKEMAPMLQPYGFITVNSGTIINPKYIKEIKGDCVTVINGTEFPIARDRRINVKKEYMRYLRGT